MQEGRNADIKRKQNIICAFVLFFLFMLISYPALFQQMVKGHDLRFHLFRIEGVVTDLSFPNIPVRLSSQWLNGYGYPVSIFYGDCFLYLAVLFRKIGFSVLNAYRMFLLCVNSITLAIAFISFRSIFQRYEIALAATAAYVTASYRLVDLYVRAALGEILAMVFFPAIVACICRLYTEDDSHKRIRSVVLLAFSLAAIVCSHIISTAMLITELLPLYLIGLFLFCKREKRIERTIDFIMAGILSILLSSFFVLPFMDYFLSVDTIATIPTKHLIQKKGVRVADLFDFWSSPFANHAGNIQRTPGILLMMVLLLALLYCVLCVFMKFKHQGQRKLIFDLVVSLVLLFKTTRYFPWDSIEQMFPFGSLLTMIQFPMRYLSFSVLFLSLLLGDCISVILTEYDISNVQAVKRSCFFFGAVLCLFCLYQCISLDVFIAQNKNKVTYQTPEDLGEWRSGAMEYLLRGVSIEQLPTEIETEAMISTELLLRHRNEFLIACTSGSEYGWIQLPVFHYKYYRVEDVEDLGRELEIHDGGNRRVGILLPPDYTGIIHVFWREPFLWRVAELISIISAGMCLGYLLYSKKRDKENCI